MTQIVYKSVQLIDTPFKVIGVYQDGAWVARINSQGMAWYGIRPLAAPKIVSGKTVVAEQVSDSGEVRGYVSEASWALVSGKLAALGAPEVDLVRTRKLLSNAYNDICEQAYEEHRRAVSALQRTGRADVAPDRSLEIKAAEDALAVFDAAHPEIRAGLETERAAGVARFLAAD